jgi:CHASE2 domain-containing sensor protein
MKKLKQILLVFIAFKITILLIGFLYHNLHLQLLHFEHLATEDIQFNDIYYATKRYQKAEFKNKDVVLINTGSIPNDILFRKKLAELINKVAENKPKTIGLDFYFPTPKNPINDSLLKDAIIKNNVVTVLDSKQKHKSIFLSRKKGLMNFPGKDEETIREYYNYIIINKDTIPSFATVLSNTKSKDTLSYLKYCTENKGYYNILDRNEKINPVNFPAIEASDFFNKSYQNQLNQIIKNKIVIIGHLGTENMHNPFDIEDKFRVPTDKSLFNRNLTMPGIVIHANAVQMMLNKAELISIDGWAYEIITSIILLIYLFLFYYIHHKFHLSKLINIILILSSTFPIVYICCVYLMDMGIYYKVGGLFGLIVFLEEFIEIYEGFMNKFNKNNNEH